MYEHFVVVGVNEVEVAAEETKIVKPEILYAYPEETRRKVDPSVKDFAFPSGVEVRGFSSKVSSTDLLSIRFSSAAQLETPESSFVFVMTTQNLLYGVCVYTQEILSDRGVIIPRKTDEETEKSENGESGSSDASKSSKSKENGDQDAEGSGKSAKGAAGGAKTPLKEGDKSISATPGTPGSLSSSKLKIEQLRANFAQKKDAGGNATLVSAKRCYLFISRFPFFQLHFDVLYSLIARDRLYRQSRMEEVKERGENETSVATGLIRQVLDAYYRQKIAEMGTTVSFSIPGEIRTIQFVCPPSDDVSSLADWCVACLLRVLSTDNIIKFFNAMVLEHRIVLISSNLGILSAVALSLIPLLRPLIWQGAFIPILPQSMLDILDAPFPLLVGLPTYPENRPLVDFCVIDLDTNTFSPPMKAQKGLRGTFSSSSLVPLPDCAKLEEKLAPMAEKMYLGTENSSNSSTSNSTFASFSPFGGGSSSSSSSSAAQSSKRHKFRDNPLRPNAAQVGTVKSVVKLFNNYIEHLLDLIRDSVIQNAFILTEENFDEQAEKVPALLPRTHRKFVKDLFQTQIFNFYSHAFLYDLAQRQLEDSLLYDKLNRLLELEFEERAALEAKLRKLPAKSNEREHADKELKSTLARITGLEKQQRELIKKDPTLNSPKRSATLRGHKSGADFDSSSSASSSPSLVIPARVSSDAIGTNASASPTTSSPVLRKQVTVSSATMRK